MDVSSQDPSLLVMDLSKGYSVPPLASRHAEAKKPEWYHRRPPSTEIGSSFRSRASSSYSSPAPPVHCRDMDQGAESLGTYNNPSLNPRVELYREHTNLWHPSFYGADQAGGAGPESSVGEESDSGSDVIFLVSSSKEPLLCSPFIQDGVRHIVEPLSPAVSLLDEGRGCYHLPQPMSSPSPDSSYSEDSSDSSADIPVHHTRPVVLLSDLSVAYRNAAESVEVSSDDSDVIEVSVSEERTFPCRKRATPDTRPEKTPSKKVRRSSRIRRSGSEARSASFSPSPRLRLRRQVKNDAIGIYNESCDSDQVMEFAARISSSEQSLSHPNESQGLSSNSDESGVDSQTDRISSQRDRISLQRDRISSQRDRKSTQRDRKSTQRDRKSTQRDRKSLHRERKSPHRERKSPQRDRKSPQRDRKSPQRDRKSPQRDRKSIQRDRKSIQRDRKSLQRDRMSPHTEETSCSDASKILKPIKKLQQTVQKPNRRIKANLQNKMSNNKRKPVARRRKKRRSKAGPPAGFPPTEPEIKLRCVNVSQEKKEKKERRPGSFCPFIHMEQRRCIVVNYQDEEEAVRTSRGRPQQTRSGCMSGFTPNSSCFQLGRCRSEIQDQTSLHCCLCGQTANTLSLGDLHGPYYLVSPAVDYQGQDHKDQYQNQDQQHGSRTEQVDSVNGLTDSPEAPPPQVSSDLDECWIHEDCGIWSAGVFLIRGKLYGLKEAARLAQETVCSACDLTGAIMGCFQKGCLTKYHYRCAVTSGCVLNEENFSVRCPEHKNKAFPQGARRHRR